MFGDTPPARNKANGISLVEIMWKCGVNANSVKKSVEPLLIEPVNEISI